MPARTRRHFGAVWLGWLAIASLASPAAGATETLTIGGTGAALGGMQLLADAFMDEHPEVEVTVLPSLGSSGGIKAVLAGAIDLAVSARPLKEEERARGARSEPYAATPVAVVTPITTPVSAVTTEELARIYAGAVTTWPDGMPIRLVLRPANETDTKLLRSIAPSLSRAVDEALARPGMLLELNDQANADTLEGLPGSIGTSTLAQVVAERRVLKTLALNGVEPSIETIRRGDYPLVKRLLLVTGPGSTDRVRSFVAFMRSREGQVILETSGHLPIRPVRSEA